MSDLAGGPNARPSEPLTPHVAWRPATPITRFVALLRGAHNAWRALLRTVRQPRRAGPYTIVVTGAGVGVGLEVARLLLTSKHRLVLTAREESLAHLAAAGIVPSDRVMIHRLDITVPEERRALVAAVSSRFGGVDVLVNNAAVSYRAVVEHVTDEEAVAQMDTNFFGPMALIRLVLPHMRERRFGRILNVSSVGGMTAMPTMAMYSASKFALEGASESLWYEARPWGIHVSLIRPGFINSDAFRKVYFTDQALASLADPGDPYHRHYRDMNELIEALMTLTFYKSEDVAETIVSTIERNNPPLRVSGTWDAAGFELLRRVLPGRVYHALLYAGLPNVWEWGDLRPPALSLSPAAHQGPEAPQEKERQREPHDMRRDRSTLQLFHASRRLAKRRAPPP
jgi:NAD(P)-dependent dehydrogenase (short-subunit alcohol dehydrogenase family)